MRVSNRDYFAVEIFEPMVRDDKEQLLAIAEESGLFTPEELELLLGDTLDAFLDGSLPEQHHVIVCRDAVSRIPLGWSYFASDAYADNVWNVWWIGVRSDCYGTGISQVLLTEVETCIRTSGGRVIVIETSDGDMTSRARRFYTKSNYGERGCIPDFYGPGDAKLVFSKTL